jgi:hypothetical protein
MNRKAESFKNIFGVLSRLFREKANSCFPVSNVPTSKISSGQQVTFRLQVGYFNPDDSKCYAVGKQM